MCGVVQGVLARSHVAKESLADAEHQYQLLLNQSRNSMMRINLFISITTMFASIFALVPAYFGTNLDSYLRDAHGVFGRVAGGVIGSFFMCVLLSHYCLIRFLQV